MFISTFSNDEPIEAIIGATKIINREWDVYITGDFTKYKNIDIILNNLPNA